MKRSLLAAILSVTIFGACASGGRRAPEDANLDEPRWRGDARLYHILLPYPIGPEQQDSLDAYALEHETATNYLLAEAVDDPLAPTVVRVNALFVLAQRRAGTHMHTFRNALDAEDVRVRAMAASAMRHFVAVLPREAISIARMALEDPEPEVQAQALQILGDSDIDLIRAYLQRAPSTELRTIAQDLVQLAEQRGAPLEGDSTTGVLSRETTDGYHITFTPVRHWPQWDAALGTARIEKDGTVVATIEDVEAVAGVVPVFLSPDARHVVFEHERSIIVRSIADGTDREIGAGIAPRPRPFTDEFVFLREITGAAQEQRSDTKLAYEVLAAPFDPPGDVPAKLLGATTATATFSRNGGYSPVRWMKIEERAASFYLTAPDMETVRLPDPFG